MACFSACAKLLRPERGNCGLRAAISLHLLDRPDLASRNDGYEPKAPKLRFEINDGFWEYEESPRRQCNAPLQTSKDVKVSGFGGGAAHRS